MTVVWIAFFALATLNLVVLSARGGSDGLADFLCILVVGVGVCLLGWEVALQLGTGSARATAFFNHFAFLGACSSGLYLLVRIPARAASRYSALTRRTYLVLAAIAPLFGFILGQLTILPGLESAVFIFSSVLLYSAGLGFLAAAFFAPPKRRTL